MRNLGQPRNDSLLTNRDLESIELTVYEERQDELVARQAFNLKTDDPPASETIGYDMISKRGVAKIMNSDAEDVPLVDADIVRKTQRVVPIKVGFKVTFDEIQKARQAGRPVETTKAGAARRSIAEQENALAYKGDAKVDIKGLVNATGITIYNVAASGTNGSTYWKDKTPMLIIEDIRVAKFDKVDKNPGCKADTLEVSPDEYGLLQKSISENNTMTIYEYLVKQGWFPAGIRSNIELKGAGLAGVNVMMVYDSRKENVQLAIPRDIFMHQPITDRNNAQQINLQENTAGLVVRYPLGITRGDGIGPA